MNYVNKFGSNKRLLYFFLVRQKTSIRNLFYTKNNNQHLFILSPPFSGSTLLNEIVSSSENVSCNNNIGVREGQQLPIVKDILCTKDRWNEKKVIDWKHIHTIWDKYWDKSKNILLEKSPPNICRAIEIEKEFTNAKFICLIRNPYAQVEGHMRRYGSPAKEAAVLSLSYLKYQKYNVENLKDVLLISYENLTDNIENVKSEIISFSAYLSDINTSMKFNAHNIRGEKEMDIINLNNEKISKINKDDLKTINSVFIKEKNLLNYFNYSLI